MPFRLLHDPALECFWRVIRQNLHRLLQQDLSAVRDLIDKMHRGSRDLHALGQSGLVDLQTVHPLAAEGGDQRGMHIQDAGGPAGGKVRTEDGEEACQNDEVDLMRRQQVGQGRLKGRLTAAALGGDRLGGNAGVGRPGQGVGSFIGGDHQRDLSVGQQSRRLRVQQCL